jgi:hypothetical protein
VRAGVSETVAMSISGHRTRSTFDRYNITNAKNTRETLETVSAWVSDEKFGQHSHKNHNKRP